MVRQSKIGNHVPICSANAWFVRRWVLAGHPANALNDDEFYASMAEEDSQLDIRHEEEGTVDETSQLGPAFAEVLQT